MVPPAGREPSPAMISLQISIRTPDLRVSKLEPHRLSFKLCVQISPYLRTYKFQRAQLLLEEYLTVTPRNGRYTPEQRAARRGFEDRFFAISVRGGTTRRLAH